MPKVKIKHGLAFYMAEEDGRDVQLTAFRGQVVNMSRSEADRLRKLDAVVDPDEELSLGGRLTPFPDTASDQELIAWVSVANKEEVERAIKERPALGDRILAAHQAIQRQLEDQDKFLSGLTDTVKSAQESAAVEDNSGPAEEDDYDEVIKGNVKEISAYLSEHPERASEIMEAENRRAAAATVEREKQPRDGVIEAVKQASSTNTQ